MHKAIMFTREELFERAWTTPMSRLAAEYSLSDVGLKKFCARHNIPTPPRGYWAKLEAGRAPSRPKLPAAKDTNEIRLWMWQPDEHAVEVEAALAVVVEDVKRPENQRTVPERLTSPCAMVRAAKESLDDARPDDLGILECPSGCLDIRVTRTQLARALRIADTLLKEFERRGWESVLDKEGTIVHVDHVSIAVTIQESMERIEVPPKPELGSSYSFHYDRRETKQRPSGHLCVSIREKQYAWLDNQRRNWRESEKRPMENCLTHVIVGMLRLASAVKGYLAEKAQKEAEQQERQRKAQAMRDEQKRLKQALDQEQARVEYLLAQANHWHKSQSIRLFVDEVRKQGNMHEIGLVGEELNKWIVWASRQADRLDPFSPSPPSILDDAERIKHMCDNLRDW